MILDASGVRVRIRKTVEMSQDVTQLLIDSEVFFVSMGLAFDLRCIACMKAGDTEGAFCKGDVSADHTAFTVECACTTRIGRGLFTVPPAPPTIHPREQLDGEKRTIQLTRDEMKQIENFEMVVFGQLKLQYLVYCLRCRMDDPTKDGVRGAKGTTGNQFVMECHCTKRIYQGADTPILTH